MQHLAELVRLLSGIPARDLDAVIGITGPERVGKSTLSFHLARAVDPTFDYTRVCFSGAELRDQVVSLPRDKPCVSLDESVAGAMSRDSQSRANKELMKFLQVCGERNKVIFLLTPNLRWFDPYIRDHRMRLWLHVPERGRCIIYEPRRGAFHAETYWNEVAAFRFPGLDDDDWRAYLRRKHEMVGNARARVDPGAAHVSRVQVDSDVEAMARLLDLVIPTTDERRVPA